jgi:hypothetical protein
MEKMDFVLDQHEKMGGGSFLKSVFESTDRLLSQIGDALPPSKLS